MSTTFRSGTQWRDSGQAWLLDEEAFDQHFHEHVEPHFDTVEKQRLSLKDQYTWRLAIAAAGTFCLFLVTLIAHTVMRNSVGGPVFDQEVIVIVPLLAAIVLTIWAQKPRRRFVRTYKETLLPAIASFFGKFSYDAEGGIGMNVLDQSTMIPSHDHYYHEDLFEGTYHDVGVEFCEARLTERRGSGKNRRTVTVFAGMFVLLTMNKNFKGKTVVRRDAGKLGNWLQGTFSGKLEPVKLEDPNFEKKFEVYSTDQVEARYLLTPAFMTRLLDLGEIIGTKSIEAAFFENRLMIKMHKGRAGSGTTLQFGNVRMHLGSSSGMFEPQSIYKSIYDTPDMNRIIEEFRSILSIIDLLKLYEKTGL